MKKHIIPFLLSLLPLQVSAELNIEFDHYMWVSVASKHTATDKEFEEFNPGLGIQSFIKNSPIFFAAGVFDNSFDSRHSDEDFGYNSDITYFIGGGLEYQGEYIGPGFNAGLVKGYFVPVFVAPYVRLGPRDWLIQSQVMVLPINLVNDFHPNVFGLSFTIKLGELF